MVQYLNLEQKRDMLRQKTRRKRIDEACNQLTLEYWAVQL